MRRHWLPSPTRTRLDHSSLASIALLLGGIFAFNDYRHVMGIYKWREADGAVFEKRIGTARGSILFTHYVDYATAMSARDPATANDAFARASHFLLDTPFMIAWANELNERGELDKARYVAQRLREFGAGGADTFFEPCGLQPNRSSILQSKETSERPFQCTPPGRSRSSTKTLDSRVLVCVRLTVSRDQRDQRFDIARA